MTEPRAGRVAARAILATALLSALACGDPKRGEAGAVLRALDVARAAPNEAKREPTEALARVPCTAEDVCRARDVCADALRHLVAGLEVDRRVKDELGRMASDGGASAERVKALEAELDRAESELDAARAGLRPCEEAASAMRRAHRI